MPDLDPHAWILWQDASLLVVDKPAGLPVLPEGWQPGAPYLTVLLTAVFGRVWVVHRLDKETSGVMVLALTAEAHRALNTQFEQRQAAKRYHALALGSPAWDETTAHLPLRADGDRRHRTVVDPRRGKPALTALAVLQRFTAPAVLLEAQPRSGRTHQIRAHLAALGHPLLGDALYQRKEQAALDPQVIARVALHARRLGLDHPLSGERLEFEAPYPADFRAALQRLQPAASLA
ncbi:MAG: RluA family pseudouridine synthase [Chloroflexota bacterium]